MRWSFGSPGSCQKVTPRLMPRPARRLATGEWIEVP